jgi:hypothetical protein
MYNLSKYYNFHGEPEKKYINVKEDGEYRIYKYDKHALSRSTYNTLGLFRSLITYKNHVVCFAPPKSQHLYDFKEANPDMTNCDISEYEDGTMINLFWDGEKWQMATRSKVGGDNSFYKGKKTYREMVEEIMGTTIEEYGETHLTRGVSYSFVLKHPSNGLFTNEKSLVHTHQFKITDHMVSMGEDMISNSDLFKRSVTVQLIERDNLPNCIHEREISDIELSWDTLHEQSFFRGVQTSKGIMIRNRDTGTMTKIRYTSANYLSNLRGNHGILLYRFCENIKQVSRFEILYLNNDEFKGDIQRFKKAYRDLVSITHNTYVSMHVHKEEIEVPKYLKPHLYSIHGVYIQTKEPTNEEKIKKYYETIPTYQLMRTLKYLL